MGPAGPDHLVNEAQATPPLDASEVMRLAKAARNAGFSRREDTFTTPKEGFTRTSLQQLAAMSKPLMSPSLSQTTSKSATQRVEEGSEPDPTTPKAPGQPPSPNETAGASTHAEILAQDIKLATDADAPTAHAGSTAAPDPATIEETTAADTRAEETILPAADSSENETLEAENGNDADILTDTAQAIQSKNAGAVRPIDLKPDLELLDEEYKRGFYEGQKAAMERQEEQLNAAIDSFNAATEALARDENIDLSQLSNAMYRAIAELASERAGIAIDNHPEDFAKRIERMVIRIRNLVETPVITLHPADADLIKVTLEARLNPRPLKIVGDYSLKRGDARVDVGEIGVMDLLESAIGTPKPAEPNSVDTRMARDETGTETGFKTTAEVEADADASAKPEAEA
jgi:flagellar biosynthesis/type III secretory pathway protein FliH